VIATSDVNTLKEVYLNLKREIWSTELSVNGKKTKYVTAPTLEASRRPQNLSVGENFEVVPSLTYSRALINSKNDTSQSRREKIQAGNWGCYANL
jgi:hypothetical protein